MNSPLSNAGVENLKQIDIVKIYNGKRCLIVDDFPEIRGSLMRTLKTFGAESVDTAANGEEAVKACTNKKYDIVLCDYNLGAGKDGQQILEEVRFLRVLLMTSLFMMITGESSREMVLGALECQPDDYITKPYTQASIKLRLDRAIIRHEALLPIKKCISSGDYRKALELCNEMISSGSRYAGDCLKMKGQLHFLLKQMKEAQQVYDSVLGKKPLVWAKLGMSKTLMAMGKNDSAEEMLKSVLEEDDRYIEAHDMLAELHESRNHMELAQNATEAATRISPKSVLRHRKLAKYAELNDDDSTSLKSHQQAIKWGTNSCHESPQDYFNYARKVSEVVQGEDSTEAKTLVKQANTFLERARKRYSDSNDVCAQAQMVETQLLMNSGEEEKAKKSAQKAKQMFSNLAAPDVETNLEMARTLHTMDDDTGARELLTRLAVRHEKDSEVMQIIDSISDEPISEAGKKVATKLTKQGIQAYDQKVYDDAIMVFRQALLSYPKHIGLNLNLIQAVIADTEQFGFKESHERLVKRCLRCMGKVGAEHKQHKRLAFLKKQLKKFYPDLV